MSLSTIICISFLSLVGLYHILSRIYMIFRSKYIIRSKNLQEQQLKNKLTQDYINDLEKQIEYYI